MADSKYDPSSGAPRIDYSKFIPTLPYDDFVPENQKNIENSFCVLCGGIAYAALKDACNHLFCSKCYEIYCPKNPYYCPITNKILNERPQPDNETNDLVSNQILACPNRQYGCPFYGKAKVYIYHILNNCMKSKVKCPMR